MGLLRASLLARDGKVKEAEAALASEAQDGDSEISLTRAQLAVNSAHHNEVYLLAESRGSILYSLDPVPYLLLVPCDILPGNKGSSMKWTCASGECTGPILLYMLACVLRLRLPIF